jgi:hypothetical protein
MSDDHDDGRWEAFVTAMLAAGPVAERRSRYGDKLALSPPAGKSSTWKRPA